MDTQVSLTETHVKSFNNYYDDIEGFKFNNIAEYNTYQDFRNQATGFKISKYIFIIRTLLSAYREPTRQIIYTNDFQVLYFTLLLRKLYKSSNTIIVYHQFELIEGHKLNKVNALFYNSVLKNAKLIDLAIFPEINRLNYFKKDSSVIKEKTFVLPNSCEPALSSEKKKHPILNQFSNDTFIVMHLGNVGGSQHYYHNFIEAVEKLESNKKVVFIFLGRKNELIEKTIKQKKLSNLFFFDPIPHEDLTQIYPYIDLGVILYKGTSPNYEFCAPNKLYELWSNGIPVIGHQLKGLEPLFDQKEKGILTNFDDISEIAKATIKCTEKEETKNALIQIFKEELSINIYLEEFGMKLKLLLN
jgi:glycosyltransferase involved in cell wall biosynthesis